MIAQKHDSQDVQPMIKEKYTHSISPVVKDSLLQKHSSVDVIYR